MANTRRKGVLSDRVRRKLFHPETIIGPNQSKANWRTSRRIFRAACRDLPPPLRATIEEVLYADLAALVEDGTRVIRHLSEFYSRCSF
jgi:hypothetical protein